MAKYQRHVAVVVAQLAEWSLPNSEIRCSNLNIGKVLRMHLSVQICQLQFRKDENKEKEAGIGGFRHEFEKKFIMRAELVKYKSTLRFSHVTLVGIR